VTIALALGLKFLHVLVAFWMTAGLAGRGITQLRLERTTDMKSFQLLLELVGRFDRLMVIPASAAVFVLGLLTAWAQGLPILGFLQGARTNWLLISLVLWIGVFALVPTVFIPRGKLFGAILEEAVSEDRVTERLAAALRDPVVRLAHIYEIAAVLVIIFLMVTKPF
jgi:uncharacterized membrane protein